MIVSWTTHEKMLPDSTGASTARLRDNGNGFPAVGRTRPEFAHGQRGEIPNPHQNQGFPHLSETRRQLVSALPRLEAEVAKAELAR